MGLYDFLKDAYNVAQQTQNPELLNALLDAQSQALALQAENARLNNLVTELQDTKALEEKIERNDAGVYITFSDDESKVKYCVVCWDNDRKRIQLERINWYSAISYKCTVCKINLHSKPTT